MEDDADTFILTMSPSDPPPPQIPPKLPPLPTKKHTP